jgi:putative transposase
VPARSSPAERVRAEIDQLFASEQDLGEVLEEVARLVIQAAVEAEVTEFLGRDPYAAASASAPGTATATPN